MSAACSSSARAAADTSVGEALSPDDTLVATGSGDGTVRVWCIADGAAWDDIDATDSGAVTHAAWSPRSAGAPLLLTAHCSLEKEAARVLVRRAAHAAACDSV